MELMKMARVIPLVCCLLPAQLFAWQESHSGLKRIYVEAFATKTDADKLREDVIAELRKLNSVSVTTDESSADLILGGGGETWIRGYHSFSPRSHMKLPTNGTPIYGGYLSVELRDRGGVTVWSDLVTPGEFSDDVSKDLAKKIARHVADALVALQHTPPLVDPPPQPAARLISAGATFPYPVYSKWFTNYRKENPAVEITYEAIGSEAGVRKLLAGGIDFAASDSPEAIHEIASGDESKYVFFPSVIGAVVPIVDLPGITNEIAFTPEALAGIYLGKITKWNDPILQAANRGVTLPDLKITVIHRADGSGTTYAWTSFLSKTSPAWKAEVGFGLAPKWPAGRAATGNDGVAKLVKEMGGSIGYVEYIYALENHLGYGKVRNQNGEFVEAGLESIVSAVSHSAGVPDDFRLSLVNAPGRGAYPITSLTWLVVPTHIADDGKRTAVTAFLKWMLGPGQRQAAALGYLALPKEIVAKEEDAIAGIH